MKLRFSLRSSAKTTCVRKHRSRTCASKMQFKILLKDTRKFPRSVLQFYAGLTGLTNEGVRNLITNVSFVRQNSGILNGGMFNYCHLSILNCIFEAQVRDLCFLTHVVFALDLKLNLSFITLTSSRLSVSGLLLILRQTHTCI